MSTGEMRPPRETPQLGLPVPGDADPADPPTDLGRLADALDILAATGLVGWRSGDMKLSAMRVPPDGWLLCNGQAVSRSVYADLFDAIGTSYGTGDGTATFNLPDLRNAFPLGAPAPADLGARGGAATVALSVNEMPHHAHAVYDPGHSHGIWTGDHGHPDPGHVHYTQADQVNEGRVVVWTSGAQGSYFMTRGSWWNPVSASAAGLHAVGNLGGGTDARGVGISLYGEGGNWAHNNMPPWCALNYFIKT